MDPSLRGRTQQTVINAATKLPTSSSSSPLSQRPGGLKTGRRPSRRTRRQYAEAINAYSKLSASNSLYAGLHFESLARYLLQPYEVQAPPDLIPRRGEEQGTDAYKFVSLYDLNPAATTPVRHIHSITEFEAESSSLSANRAHGQLLFMRGHPSPEWLTSIGAKYDVEPDFFQRHLDFRPQHADFFSLPSLPSSSEFMVRLRIATIGCAKIEAGKRATQEALETLRSRNTESLRIYFEKLKSHSGPNLGDSIVRDCSVHDMQHFTVEQDISICVKPIAATWIAFIWLDNGNDLGESLTSWLTAPLNQYSWKSKIKYLPVVHHKPGIALERRSPRQVTPFDRNDGGTAKIVQSASLLHLDYGRDMDRDILGIDSFYALHEVFSFAAFADAQFLNMLEYQLARELDQSALIEQASPTLSNLLYNQQILERYIQRIQNTVTFIEGRASGDWPSGNMEGGKRLKADAATRLLRQDYEYLLSRGTNLCEQCNKGMQVIMNNAVIKESREAISQAGELAKLTRLAFVFIPLSFTTSFFGMNLHQLGSGYLDIWVGIAVSFPYSFYRFCL